MVNNDAIKEIRRYHLEGYQPKIEEVNHVNFNMCINLELQ
jgi:hypothetical protein